MFYGGRLAGDECELFDLHDTGDCPKVNRKLASNSTLKSFVKEREFCTFVHSLARSHYLPDAARLITYTFYTYPSPARLW